MNVMKPAPRTPRRPRAKAPVPDRSETLAGGIRRACGCLRSSAIFHRQRFCDGDRRRLSAGEIVLGEAPLETEQELLSSLSLVGVLVFGGRSAIVAEGLHLF